jgi:tetratricopeptide (TPR) repeat protein
VKLRLLVAVISFAAALPDFGQNLYEARFETAVAAFNRAEYAAAADAFRVAAFGFIDDIPRYETAEIYLAVASDKLGRRNDARLAASKFIEAEAVRPVYTTLPIAPSLRNAFDSLLPVLLTREERANTPGVARSGNQPPKVPMPPTAPDIAVTVKKNDAVAAPPKPAPAPAPPIAVVPTVSDQIAAAEKLLGAGNIVGSRTELRRIAGIANLPRSERQSLARALSQAALYFESSTQYRKTYPLKPGEESHMFYEAVNRYELGDYGLARALITRALPALPQTAPILAWRDRIMAHP